jgi:hypothetical protein
MHGGTGDGTLTDHRGASGHTFAIAPLDDAMTLTRSELDERLHTLEVRALILLRDRNTFPRKFEDDVEILLGQVSAQDQDYALAQLEAIVERSGFNR